MTCRFSDNFLADSSQITRRLLTILGYHFRFYIIPENGKGRMMRLTLVTETFPPDVNGVARTLGRWVDWFQQRGHGVRVIRPHRPHEPITADHPPGLSIPFYPEVTIGLTIPSQVRDLLIRTATDLVHIATEGPLGLAALHAAERARLPIVSSFHTNFDHYLRHYGFGWLERLMRSYLRWFHNRTAFSLVPSEGTRQRLLGYGFQRVEIWSRGVDGEFFHPQHRDPELRRSFGVEDDDLLVLCVGRLAPEKNLDALLDAFTRLRQRLGPGKAQGIKLALVGGGPLFENLRERWGSEVILPGYQKEQDLGRWYSSADLFAFPSCSETFGNVILEAQASGLPVVSFDYPEMRERIHHGEDGFLVPMHGDMTEALHRLCTDAELRRQMRNGARRTAEKQDWQAIFTTLEERYRTLLTEQERHQGRERRRRRLADFNPFSALVFRFLAYFSSNRLSSWSLTKLK